MSDSESFTAAACKFSPRGFVRTLVLGSFCAAAALMMQKANFNAQRNTIVRLPILTRLIDEPRTIQNSAYDEESTMSAAQLIDRWDSFMTEASQRFHVPKTWIKAVMRQESGGRTMLDENQPMVSRAGAIGLMQILPETYGEMASEHRLGANPFDARDNILAGAAYLQWLHHKYGYPAMFAAYNAGPGRVEDHLNQGASLPAETRAYIGGIAKRLKFQTGKSESELVELTRPDGTSVKIDPRQVTAIRAALPGEYAPGVQSVLTLGDHKQQGIREEVQIAAAAIRAGGKPI